MGTPPFPSRTAQPRRVRLARGWDSPPPLLPCQDEGGAGSRHRPDSITVVIYAMAIAYSKLTAQGQISVPTEVRRRLGIGPGSVLEWDEEGERIVVRRAGRYTSEDMHRALFEEAPEPRTLEELKEGVRQYVRGRHARR